MWNPCLIAHQIAHQNWINVRDNNTISFLNSSHYQDEENFIREIVDENEIWKEDQNAILQVYSREFC